VPAFLIAGDECVERHTLALHARPWLRVICSNDDDLRAAFDRLLEEGIRRVSVIGGRSTATRLVDAELIQDIYLTTTSLEGGEPGTPWYCGTRQPQLTPITKKQWHERESPVVFEHLLIGQ
jgi:riboflavin biosynthesis pyrimidine reductase